VKIFLLSENKRISDGVNIRVWFCRIIGLKNVFTGKGSAVEYNFSSNNFSKNLQTPIDK